MRPCTRFTVISALAAITLVAAGCGNHLKQTLGLSNQPPEVQLTSTAVPGSGAADFVHRLEWTATDRDGRVAYCLVTEDARAVSASAAGWTRVEERQRFLAVRQARPATAGAPDAMEPGFRLFAVRAVDDGGAVSLPATRAFFGANVAPTVEIVSPRPSHLLDAVMPPVGGNIRWQGTDPDGPNGKPAKYKYKLLTEPREIQTFTLDPDSLRRAYAPVFAGWDSTGPESTSVRLTNLTLGSLCMFAITAFDAQGAYDPVFTLDKNMLRMAVMSAGISGPILTMYSDYFDYTYTSGGWSTAPSRVVSVELPACRPITIHWSARPTLSHEIGGYRWVLDPADLSDKTPRHGPHDWSHWSAWSTTSTSATLRFCGDEHGLQDHFLYIEVEDDFGMRSLGIIHIYPVRATFGRDLLVVNDTRFTPETIRNGVVQPVGLWPNIAELDTFLFARGGVPWRGYAGMTSPAGIFNGYDFDTLGTRTKRSDLTVPLSVLGKYRHVIWMVDGGKGASNLGEGTDPVYPRSALRYMSGPCKANTLAAYLAQGGRVWLLGGGCGFASMDAWPFNPPPGNVFSNSAKELIPGRFMYDAVHWRSEFTSLQVARVSLQRYSRPVHDRCGRPEYSLLPAVLELRSPATDPLSQWPGRTSFQFYRAQSEIEYLSQPNDILEDVLPSPRHRWMVSALDTLLVATGTGLPPQGPNGPWNACMTRYEGRDNGEVIFSGHNVWSWRRAQCLQLVDAVLQGMWRLHRGVATEEPVAGAPDTPLEDRRRGR